MTCSVPLASLVSWARWSLLELSSVILCLHQCVACPLTHTQAYTCISIVSRKLGSRTPIDVHFAWEQFSWGPVSTVGRVTRNMTMEGKVGWGGELSPDCTCPRPGYWCSLKPGREGAGGENWKWHQMTASFGGIREGAKAVRQVRKSCLWITGPSWHSFKSFIKIKKGREKVIYWTQATAFNSPTARKTKARN